VGGLGFWLPHIGASAIFHVETSSSFILLNVIPVLGLTALLLAIWMRQKLAPRWGSVLAGVYILGPIGILTAWKLESGWHWTPETLSFAVLLSLFPPMTLWLATYDPTILSVLAVTIVLFVLAVRHKWESE
jgi:hypothetical protein